MPTLKEQHLEAIKTLLYTTKPACVFGKDRAAEACTAITESYSEGFAEWLGKNKWKYDGGNKWLLNDGEDERIYKTTAELRHLYNQANQK